MRRLGSLQVRILLILVLAITAVTIVLATRDTDSSPDPAADPVRLGLAAGSREHAQATCQNIAGMVALITKNSSKENVLAYLQAALDEAKAAVQTDPGLRSFESGVISISQGLSNDSASMASVGIDILRDQCRLYDVYLPGSVTPSASPSTEPEPSPSG